MLAGAHCTIYLVGPAVCTVLSQPNGNRVLGLLRWRVGTLLLGGYAAVTPFPPFCQPFTQLSLAAREQLLQGWANSALPPFLKVSATPPNASLATILREHH